MRELVPLVEVRDLDATLAFYRGTLGFRLCWREGDTASVQHGKVGLMFSTADNLGAEPAFAGTFYLYPENVDRLWEELRRAVEVEWPLQEMSYGTREFAVRDPDGYLLAFAEVDED